MGRSKSKRNSLPPATSPKTPTTIAGRKSVDPNLNTATSGKGPVKRPLPTESDSEEDEKKQSFTLNLENGFPKSKKGKFSLDANDVESSEDDEGSDEVENSSEDGAEIGDSEDTEEESDEEEESDDSDSPPATASPKKDVQIVKSQAEPVKTPTSAKKHGTSQPADQSESGFLVIPNAPKDHDKIRKLFTDMGHSVTSVQPLRVPLTLVTLSTPDSAKAIISSQKPLSIDGNTINVIRLEGVKNVNALAMGSASNSVFVTGIPKSVTMELLKSKLPSNCKPDSVKLLQSGPKNRHFNAAYINFSSAEPATAALKALSQVKFDGQSLRVSYGRDMPTPQTSEPSASKFSAEVHGIPPNTDVKQILAAFPGATNAIRHFQGHYSLDFPSAEARLSAVAGKKTIRNSTLKVLVFGGIRGNIAFLKNLPFESSVDELRSIYPDASKVEIHRKANGLSTGTATLEFSTAEACRSAVDANHQLKGRRIFASLKRVDVNATEKAPVTPKETRPQKNQPSKQVPPQVGSASEDEEESDDDAESEDDDEDEEEDEEESEEEEDSAIQQQPGQKSKPPKVQEAAVDSDKDDEDEDDVEGEDTDEDDDDDESDDASEHQGTDDEEEEEEESDEEMPMVQQKKSTPKNQGNQFQKGFNNKMKGNNAPGGGGGLKRGGGGGEGGFKNRGRGGGFNNRGGGGRGGGGFKNRGGRGGGGRGGGGFNKRGGGFKGNRGKRGF